MEEEKINQNCREKIIADYFSGGVTFRELQAKYGVDYRTIHGWVQQFKGNYASAVKPKLTKNVKRKADLPPVVKSLQDELYKAKLYNKLLETMIDIGKEQYGIDLRKKPGTKQ